MRVKQKSGCVLSFFIFNNMSYTKILFVKTVYIPCTVYRPEYKNRQGLVTRCMVEMFVDNFLATPDLRPN